MFLATIMGMQVYEDTGEVDVLKVVSTMRQDRGGMVQNKNQYIFIHKVSASYVCTYMNNFFLCTCCAYSVIN